MTGQPYYSTDSPTGAAGQYGDSQYHVQPQSNGPDVHQGYLQQPPQMVWDYFQQLYQMAPGEFQQHPQMPQDYSQSSAQMPDYLNNQSPMGMQAESPGTPTPAHRVPRPRPRPRGGRRRRDININLVAAIHGVSPVMQRIDANTRVMTHPDGTTVTQVRDPVTDVTTTTIDHANPHPGQASRTVIDSVRSARLF